MFLKQFLQAIIKFGIFFINLKLFLVEKEFFLNHGREENFVRIYLRLKKICVLKSDASLLDLFSQFFGVKYQVCALAINWCFCLKNDLFLKHGGT